MRDKEAVLPPIPQLVNGLSGDGDIGDGDIGDGDGNGEVSPEQLQAQSYEHKQEQIKCEYMTEAYPSRSSIPLQISLRLGSSGFEKAPVHATATAKAATHVGTEAGNNTGLHATSMTDRR